MVRNTCQGFTNQTDRAWTLSVWHLYQGIQTAPSVEPPVHVSAVGELGIGCVSQHQTSAHTVICSPNVEKIEQRASLSLIAIKVSSGCFCSCRKPGACFPDSLQVKRVFYFENFITLPHSSSLIFLFRSLKVVITTENCLFSPLKNGSSKIELELETFKWFFSPHAVADLVDSESF